MSRSRILCAFVVGPALTASVALAEVEFIADPPAGTTAFPNLVQFRVSNVGNQSPLFEASLGAGVTGSAIVTAMKEDMDSFANPFSNAGTVVANRLVVPTATNGWYSAAAEVGLSMNTSGGGGGISHLDLPLGIPQSDSDHLLVLLLHDTVSPERPAGADGSVNVALMVDGTPLTAVIPFTAMQTPGEILRGVDAAMEDLVYPAGARYAGLRDGFPTILLADYEDLGLNLRIASDGPVLFNVGGVIAPPIPEPASLALLGIAAAGLMRRRR